jgi:hypothetical protein
VFTETGGPKEGFPVEEFDADCWARPSLEAQQLNNISTQKYHESLVRVSDKPPIHCTVRNVTLPKDTQAKRFLEDESSLGKPFTYPIV